MRSISRSSVVAVAVTALALVLAGTALGVKSGVWDGTTSQVNRESGYAMPFSFETNGHNKVTVIYYGGNWVGSSADCARADGPDGDRLDPNTGFRGFPIKHNRFGGSVTLGGSEHVTLHGQFKGKDVSGSFTDSFTERLPTGKIHCSTGKVRFSAKPGDELI
jgi:hypothetical protein